MAANQQPEAGTLLPPATRPPVDTSTNAMDRIRAATFRRYQEHPDELLPRVLAPERILDLDERLERIAIDLYCLPEQPLTVAQRALVAVITRELTRRMP